MQQFCLVAGLGAMLAGGWFTVSSLAWDGPVAMILAGVLFYYGR